MNRQSEKTELKDACIQAAREVIAEKGVEALSLRDVARRLGVSHQAPYKHYPSRDHLLAEVMRRCFEDFARELDLRARSADAREELGEVGKRYLRYAAQHPLEYRLMFGTPWPAPANHPELVRDATHAFDVLRKVLVRVLGDDVGRTHLDLNALFIWSCVHGLSTIAASDVVTQLGVDASTSAHAPQHVLDMIGHALAGLQSRNG